MTKMRYVEVKKNGNEVDINITPKYKSGDHFIQIHTTLEEIKALVNQLETSSEYQSIRNDSVSIREDSVNF